MSLVPYEPTSNIKMDAYFFVKSLAKHPTEMSAPPTSTALVAPPQEKDLLPNPTVLLQAAKLAMAQDKPIQLDYYADTHSGKAFMGEDSESKEKMLVKSPEEFTSLIQKVYKVADDYIIMTENSIYLASGKIQKRRIQASSLRNDE
jgi:hypothetical protein